MKMRVICIEKIIVLKGSMSKKQQPYSKQSVVAVFVCKFLLHFFAMTGIHLLIFFRIHAKVGTEHLCKVGRTRKVQNICNVRHTLFLNGE